MCWKMKALAARLEDERQEREKKGKIQNLFMFNFIAQKTGHLFSWWRWWPFTLENLKKFRSQKSRRRPSCENLLHPPFRVIIDFHVCPFSFAVASQGCNNTVPTKTTSKWPGHSCQRSSVHHTRKLCCTNTRGKYLIITSSPLTLCSFHRCFMLRAP